jgi:carboxymethylenebutenolidase
MCELDQFNSASGGVNRRQFTAVGALAAFAAACAPIEGATGQSALAERTVSFAAPGGTMDAFFVHPGAGKHPAVIVWPDIAGLRDSFKVMARRLASSGYSVLVVNPYYRDLPAPQFQDFEDFRANEGFQKVGPWRGRMNADGVTETARAVVGWLDRQPAVDTTKGIGNQGYCMGGPYTIWTAAAVPSRVKAGASFHGGGLVGEDPKAPIHLLDDVADDARFLIAIAQNDDARSPAEKDTLRAAAAAAGVPVEIEVYAGDHGWTVPDSPVYNEAAAERAWGRLLALYSAAL